MIPRHLLIAFGGLAGLEESTEEDRNLKVKYFTSSIGCHILVVKVKLSWLVRLCVCVCVCSSTSSYALNVLLWNWRLALAS